MTKTRSFSIFLLKEGFDPTNTLKDETKLEPGGQADALPEGAVIHILDSAPQPPWWKSYFGVQKHLLQASKGALVILPAAGRWFALSFGQVHHNLKDTSYEYDFGLRVTLNCVDPEKLKSTDVLEPSGAKRQRTQLPTAGDLTYFDIDADSTVLKSLTGKVKDEHKDLFRHATGSSNIRISSGVASADLAGLCEALLDLYNDETFKTAFPDIQNISPVRDPVVIGGLNDKLGEAIRGKDERLSLSVPEIQSYGDGLWGTFSGAGGGKVYDDLFIDRYYEYLADAEVELASVEIDTLRKHQLALTNEEGNVVRDSFSILKCLIFDTTLGAGGATYHLCEGHWYLVDANYIARLTTYLDPLCKDTTLPPFAHDDEGAYNIHASAALAGRVCLDMKNVAPDGQKQVEPCDIYEVVDGKAVLHHVKISTLSAQLSHLFNQGTNSVSLLRSETAAMAKMKALLTEKAPALAEALSVPLEADQLKVVFGIITHKDKASKSLNLPLFSRISLVRCMKELRRMGIEAEFGFIPDNSPPSEGKTKVRKKKPVAAGEG